MNRDQVVGVLLAGGLSRRMGGGDKCLRELGGQTILARIVDRAGPQVGALVLNANGDPARFAAFGLPVATDAVEGYAGPLAGVLTGMERSEEHTSELQSLMRISYAVFCLKKKKSSTKVHDTEYASMKPSQQYKPNNQVINND